MILYLLPSSICPGPIVLQALWLSVRICKMVQVNVVSRTTVRFQHLKSSPYDCSPTFDSAIQYNCADADDLF